jgi:NitT/TauT family transport system substrate-binding protein
MIVLKRLARALLALGVGSVGIGALGLAACNRAPAPSTAAVRIPVRIAVSPASGQGPLPYIIKKHHLDEKYGFDVQETDYVQPGQQFILVRANAVDIIPCNFIDLLRQRHAGVKLQAFHGFESYSNQILVPVDSKIRQFRDLKGVRMGEFSTTSLDWLILRSGGKRTYGVDLQTDAKPVGGAPPLLNNLMERGSIDATLQFRSVALAPVANGKARVLTDLPAFMASAGFNPKAFYVQWNIAEPWLKAHPGQLARLDAMISEAYTLLDNDDEAWATIAKQIGLPPALIGRYRDASRRIENPPYDASLIAPTQTLLDSIIAVTGAASVGATKVDPDAFLFPAQGGRGAGA